MTTAMSADHSSPLGLALRALMLALLSLGAVLAVAFAAFAALAIGFVVAGAALTLSLAPRRPTPARAKVLDARRTPNGWVVEAGNRRS